MSFSRESELQAFLAENFSAVFPRLTLHKAQQWTPVGIVDLLAVDATGCRYYIELKCPEARERTLGQVCRYLGYQKHTDATQEAVGVIVAPRISTRLICAASVVPNIQLYELKERPSAPRLVLCTCVEANPLKSWAGKVFPATA